MLLMGISLPFSLGPISNLPEHLCLCHLAVAGRVRVSVQEHEGVKVEMERSGPFPQFDASPARWCGGYGGWAVITFLLTASFDVSTVCSPVLVV